MPLGKVLLFGFVLVGGLLTVLGAATGAAWMWDNPRGRWYDRVFGGHNRARWFFIFTGAATAGVGILGLMGVLG